MGLAMICLGSKIQYSIITEETSSLRNDSSMTLPKQNGSADATELPINSTNSSSGPSAGNYIYDLAMYLLRPQYSLSHIVNYSLFV